MCAMYRIRRRELHMAWPIAGLLSATLMGFLPFAALILPAWSEAFPPATTHLPFARSARARTFLPGGPTTVFGLR